MPFWSSAGLHVNAPVAGSIEAPVGGSSSPYVRVSGGRSSSVALATKASVDISSTACSGIASRTGWVFWVGMIKMLTESDAVAVPSPAVSVSVSVVLELTRGAVKVVDGEVELANCMARAESWVHE